MASLTAYLSTCTLGQYLLRRHTSDKVEQSSLPSDFCVDAENDGYVHVKSGVFVHCQPIRLCEGGSYHVLFHYTQKHSFDKIKQSEGGLSAKLAMLKASRDLSQDCDFGVGVYATEKGPDEFHDGIKGILLNNYPRKGPWGFAGEPGEEHHYMASYCIPIIVPRHWTKCFPLTSEVYAPKIFGPIRERKMRQGYAFDPDRHNICVILNADMRKSGELVDGGCCMEDMIKDEIDDGLGKHNAEMFTEAELAARDAKKEAEHEAEEAEHEAKEAEHEAEMAKIEAEFEAMYDAVIAKHTGGTAMHKAAIEAKRGWAADNEAKCRAESKALEAQRAQLMAEAVAEHKARIVRTEDGWAKCIALIRPTALSEAKLGERMALYVEERKARLEKEKARLEGNLEESKAKLEAEFQAKEAKREAKHEAQIEKLRAQEAKWRVKSKAIEAQR